MGHKRRESPYESIYENIEGKPLGIPNKTSETRGRVSRVTWRAARVKKRKRRAAIASLSQRLPALVTTQCRGGLEQGSLTVLLSDL